MSRLDELIAEFCPNGVEYKPLGTVCTIETGKLNANAAVENGEYAFFTTAKEISRIDKYRWDTEALLIAGNANVGDVKHYVGKFEAYQRTYVLTQFDKDISVRFLYYCLCNNLKSYLEGRKNEAAMTYIVLGTLQDFMIPVPPIEVQSEIVRILDNFTNLTAELTAELTARKKQYEYYRDQLLNVRITDLCPNGVEYRKIGELADYEQPGKYIVNNTSYDDSYETPVLTAGQSFILGYTHETTGIYDASPEKPVIIFDDFTGAFKWVDFPFKVKSSAIKMLTAKGEVASLRYIYHLMGFLNYTSDEHKRLWISIYSQLRVPVPPLPVQKKIAQVLDNFDAVCSDLNIGLPAEIEARRKQYEYYRDLLLSFNTSPSTDVERERERVGARRSDEIKLLQYVFGYANVRLSELFETCNGYTPSKNNPAYWEGNTCVPWFRMEDIRKNGRILHDAIQHVTPEAVKGSLFPANSFIVATCATIGEHALITVPSLANQRFTYLMCRPDYAALIDMKYMFYYCFKLDEYCKNHLNQGHFASVDMSKFREFVFSLPPIDKQREIADILDRFDALCNDITRGLPAEIEARRQQYEYYRDKLLTFKEA